MGLITFQDENGVRWRVWQVDTPAARAHLLEQSFRTGWLVFEREDGEERRRLMQVPDDWASLSPQRLELLCGLAIPVVAGRNTPTGQQAAWPRPTSETRGDR